ncbi:hypothetical protein SHIRM173S_02504 [Streptomyces hirsutus]
METSGDSEGPRSKKSTLYMRGLNGEKELDGTALVEKVTDSTGTDITDSRQYAGFVRETIVYNGTEELSGTINTPWSHKTGSHTYNWGTTESWIVQAGETTTRTKTSTGTRTVKQKTTYDTTYGMPVTVEDSGDAAKSGDESCARTSYARNTSAWLVKHGVAHRDLLGHLHGHPGHPRRRRLRRHHELRRRSGRGCTHQG